MQIKRIKNTYKILQYNSYNFTDIIYFKNNKINSLLNSTELFPKLSMIRFIYGIKSDSMLINNSDSNISWSIGSS